MNRKKGNMVHDLFEFRDPEFAFIPRSETDVCKTFLPRSLYMHLIGMESVLTSVYMWFHSNQTDSAILVLHGEGKIIRYIDVKVKMSRSLSIES